MVFKPEFKLNYKNLDETCRDLNIVHGSSEGTLDKSYVPTMLCPWPINIHEAI